MHGLVTYAGHARRVERCRQCIRFIRENLPCLTLRSNAINWWSIAKLAVLNGLYASKRSYTIIGMWLEQIWRKRVYWESKEAFTRLPCGALVVWYTKNKQHE